MSLDEFRSKRIRVFRNGDLYDTGKKLVVNTRVYRNFEQFLARLSDEINLVNGAARRVYTLDGHIIRALDDLKDGAIYVATGGEQFKKIPYLVTADIPASAITGATDGRQSKIAHVRDSFNRRKPSGWGVNVVNGRFGTSRVQDDEGRKRERERPLFGPTSKAFKVNVFINGQATTPGTKILLNYRNCRSWDQLIKNLTDMLRISVRRLYDAETGHRVSNMRQVHDGQNLVAAVNEGFKPVAYQIDQTSQGRKHEDDAPKIVTFFPNGDMYHTGQTVTVTKKRFPNMPRLVDHLNHQIRLVTGMIQKVYDLEGNRIQAVEDIKHNGAYVVVSNNDPFIRVRYNVNAPVTIEHPVKGLAGQTQKNEHMKAIRKLKKKRQESMTDGEESDMEREKRTRKGRQSREPSLPHVPDDETESKVIKKAVAKKPNAKHHTIDEKHEDQSEVEKPRQEKAKEKQQARIDKIEHERELRAVEQERARHQIPVQKKQPAVHNEREQEQVGRQIVDSDRPVGSPHKYRRISKTKDDLADDNEKTPAPVENTDEEGLVSRITKKVIHAVDDAVNGDEEADQNNRQSKTMKQQQKPAHQGKAQDDEDEIEDHHISTDYSVDGHEMYGESSEVRVMKSSNKKLSAEYDDDDQIANHHKIRKAAPRTQSRGDEDEYETVTVVKKKGEKKAQGSMDQDEDNDNTTRIQKLNELGSRASLRLSQSGINRKEAEDEHTKVIHKQAKQTNQAKSNSNPVMSGMQTDFKSDDEDGPEEYEDEMEEVGEREIRKLESREGKGGRKVVPGLPKKKILA